MKKLLILLWLTLAILPIAYARTHNEAYYQDKWCSVNKGQTEYRLEDYTRVDCLTDTHAIEFDFANKWAESIGQSLHYARMTGKKAGIVLIIEKDKDMVYYNRIKPLCDELGITIWKYEQKKRAEALNRKYPT